MAMKVDSNNNSVSKSFYSLMAKILGIIQDIMNLILVRWNTYSHIVECIKLRDVPR